jgi:chromosomal replication initiation ATPase DnaA
MSSIEYEIRARLYRNVAAAFLLAANQMDEVAANCRTEEEESDRPAEVRVIYLVRQEVANHMLVSLPNLDGASSKRSSSWGRQYCWILLDSLPLGFTNQDLARIFGRRAHGTVSHGIQAAQQRIENDPDEYDWLTDIHAKACRILGVETSAYPLNANIEPRA